MSNYFDSADHPDFHRRRLFHLFRLGLILFVTVFLYGAVKGTTAQAESLSIVKDLNVHARWQTYDSRSNGQVSFQIQRAGPDARSRLYLSDSSGTRRVDISSIQATSGITVEEIFLTEKFLYLLRNDGKFFQLSLDGQQLRSIPSPARPTLYFNDPLLAVRPDGVYLHAITINENIYILKLDEDAATLKITGQAVRNVGSYIDAAMVNDRILFHTGFSIWSVGLSDRDPVRLAYNSWGLRLVEVENLVYFSMGSRTGGRQCLLWRSDGTLDGTFTLATLGLSEGDPSRGPRHCGLELLRLGGDRVMVTSIDIRNKLARIYATQGSADSTRLLRSFKLAEGQNRLNLSKVADRIWFTRLNRQRRPIVFTADSEFNDWQRVRARAKNTLIDFFPVGDHMLMQTGDGDTSTLYRAAADGSNLTAVLRTINRLDSDQISSVETQAIFPFKPPGEPREILLSLEPATGQRMTRTGLREVNDSAAVQDEIFEGPDDTVIFCAVDGTEDRIPTSVSGLTATPSDADLWRTDGTPENTQKIITDLEPPAYQRYCGHFAVAEDRIFYTRGTRPRGQRKADLWWANLDGTDARPLLEAGQSDGVYPNPESLTVMADGGLLFSAIVNINGVNRRRLARAFPDGRVEFLRAEPRLPMVLGRYGDQYWVSSDTPSRPELWVTDGSVAGTQKIADSTSAYELAEINGDIYYLAERNSNGRGNQGLYRVSAGTLTPELVTIFDIQDELDACCTNAPVLSKLITDLQVFDGDLVFIQKRNQATDREQVRRLDVQTGEETLLTEFESSAEKFESLAVLNGNLYIFKHRFVNFVGFPEWEILRSAGAPGDAVKIYGQTGGSMVPRGTRLDVRGEMKNLASALWFFAPDQTVGNELWRLTP